MNPIKINKMKSLKTLTLAMTMIFAFSLTTNVNASELAKNKVVQLQKVQNAMDRVVDFPQEAKDLGITGTVKAQIEVGIDGKIEVEEINGHPELTAYVSKQLKNVSIDDISLSGQSFIAKFEFRN
jgi:outer membrane biosynthesis protein TonB